VTRRGLILLAGATLSLVLSLDSQALAAKTLVSTIGSATAGVSGGFFNSPRSVAVNQSGAGGVPAGSFYVVDAANNRVQQFGPTGMFVRAWGWGVKDGEAEFQICAKAENCKAGKGGAGAGQFGFGGAQGIAVDQSNGNVYISDQVNNRISVFRATGAFLGAFGWKVMTAAPAEQLQFCTSATGCQAGSSGPGAGQFAGGVGNLAVAPSGSPNAGDVYIANKIERRVDEFRPKIEGGFVTDVTFVGGFGWGSSTGAAEFQVCTSSCVVPAAAGAGLGQFGANSPSDVTIDSEGKIFALDIANKRVQEFSATPEPLTAAFGAVALGEVFDNGATKGELQNVAVDTSSVPNHILVSGKRSANANQIAIAELDHAGNNALGAGLAHGSDLTITAATGLADASAALGGNLYLASNNGGHRVFVLNEVPIIEPVTTFTGTTAIFKGQVVSNEIPVNYHFEYSTDGLSWIRVPTTDTGAGSAPGTIAVEQEVSGLTGLQFYRVRLVQNRPLGGGTAVSTESTFTTEAAAPAIAGAVASNVTDSTATLNADLDPQNEATTYHFEYGTADCAANPCASSPSIEAVGGGFRPVAQSVTGLQPSTVYHFRLVATNATGTTTGPDRTFVTFAPGAKLPDSRAYELVSPADTGAIQPGAAALGEADGIDCFATSLTTETGESFVFTAEGGSLPGANATGYRDPYEAIRGPSGWVTHLVGPSGVESQRPAAGHCFSADHGYSTFQTGMAPFDSGSLVVNGQRTSYVRDPDGSFELIGKGSINTDPGANVKWISAGGGHTIFTSELQLEPEAPESIGPGTGQFLAVPVDAIYDRTPDGMTHVASLLPNNEAPPPGTTTFYQGTSRDGSAVVFKLEEDEFGEGGKTTMYERRDNSITVPVVTGASIGTATFAGVSSGGDKVFYVEPDELGQPSNSHIGKLFAFDADTQETTLITPGGSASFVNVSTDGSHVYFVSPEQLDGEQGTLGEPNLYLWESASEVVHFIATLAEQDIQGGETESSLANWTRSAVNPNMNVTFGPANDPSRITPGGDVFVFESHADLVPPFEVDGHTAIYRYDAGSQGLTCVSCNPEGAPTATDAHLQGISGRESTSALVEIPNVTSNGQVVFYETTESLVPADVNNALDVYEWNDGEISLISSGRNHLPSRLYAMTPDGHDVFFITNDTLVPEDKSETGSIYDARVDGGFPVSTVPEECEGDACQASVGGPPALTGAGSSVFQGPGNAKSHKVRTKCGKGKKKVRRHRKVRCVRRRDHRRHHGLGGSR
jgi:NHL repeat